MDDKPKEKEVNSRAAKYVNPLGKGKLRNMICICGSGKKVKKCHGKDHAVDSLMLNEINRIIDKNNKAYQAELKRQWQETNNKND